MTILVFIRNIPIEKALLGFTLEVQKVPTAKNNSINIPRKKQETRSLQEGLAFCWESSSLGLYDLAVSTRLAKKPLVDPET